MRKLSLTPLARRDLRAIWLYIAQDSVVHADLVEEAIFATCDFAGTHPDAGHARTEARDARVRFLTVPRYRKYVIAYIPTKRGVQVVRVLHGARDLSALI